MMTKTKAKAKKKKKVYSAEEIAQRKKEQALRRLCSPKAAPPAAGSKETAALRFGIS